MKKTAAKHTRKHSGTKKHKNTAKHTGTKKHAPDAHQLHEAHLHHEHEEHLAHVKDVHVKAKPATHAKAKSLALVQGDLGCCAGEALAASLRLAGASVAGADVVALHKLAGADDEFGAPIAVLLQAAAEFGLAGYRPVFEEVMPSATRLPATGLHATRAGLILGVELPGPHAVLATPEGWWSWGSLWCPCEFPDAVIDEAWAVEWAVAA